MKNQYFGDFGDYQKFSLLKCFRDEGNLNIIVHWVKTKDDFSTDGKRITYLEDSPNWRTFDWEIFEFLKEHIKNKRRDLALYETSKHAVGIKFINDHIEELGARNKIIEAIKKDTKSDLIFFDPDNGTEVKSTNKKNLHKYTLWSDIEAAYNSGKSVLVYQHFGRQNREIFIRGKIKEIKARFNCEVLAIKVKHSVYFLLVQKNHQPKIKNALEKYKNIWKDLVSITN